MRSLVALLLAATALGGCASQGSDNPLIDGLGLQATPTTGVVRGVVVDDAIRPLAGVGVVLAGAGQGKERATTTNANGLFGFEAVEPGTHFLRVAKLGYAETQQSVQVEAGDSTPPLVKVQLVAVPGAAPYVQSFKFNGFLECALSAAALCSVFNGPTCGVSEPQTGTELPCTGNVTNDNFASVVPVEKPPQLVQSEIVWTTTTAASDQLWLWHSQADKATGAYNGSCNCWAQGTSPLLMATNETTAEENSYGTWHDVYLRVFTGSIEGTRNPLDNPGCYPGDPAKPAFDVIGRDPDVYCGGVGYSAEQGFTIYTHVFYGYLPPAGWRFTATPDVPTPE